MPELSSRYNFIETESKWLKTWKDNNTFHAVVDHSKKPFTVVIPPPNVTGILHMGHALNNTLQDILIRYKRMNGYQALWMPGTDHAGIATQNVVEKQLAKEGKRRDDLGRDAFTQRLWQWKKEYGDTIIHQLEKLGSSCDWPRTRFTMDESYSDAVKEVFIRLYQKNLIYQGKYIINWCPRCQTALSDEEVEHQEKNGKLYHIRYPLKDDHSIDIIVATTRPETMLGDTAVAVNPKDERYKNLIGKVLILPIVKREIHIIADDYVTSDFGSGAVKVTPAHDPNDFAMGQRHDLEFINIMHPDGRLNEKTGAYVNLDRFEARKKILVQLENEGYLVKVEDHKHSVGHCYRCDTVVEPYLSKQWFVRMSPLAKPALKAVQNGEIIIRPIRFEKFYTNWMESIRDWCISRQIWWGHRIPVWYDQEDNIYVAHNEAEAKLQAFTKHGKDVSLKQDDDVLDTWFSSWLWPFATLGWPHKNPDLEYFYPTHTLFTASEIIFFWVARMIMAGYEFMGKAPFTQVYIHGTVRDAKGRKMSKSLGNAIDPLEIIQEYGADALRFSLIFNSGQDIYISKEKFEIGRNFANKIWNASRLVLSNTERVLVSGEYEDLKIEELDLPSRWILARLDMTINKVADCIENFKYSDAEIAAQDFFWGDYCDWYLELIKSKFDRPAIAACALYVLKNSLKLLHPFIPFVTEELYSHFNSKDACLSVAAWPKVPLNLLDQKACEQMQGIIDIIRAIRSIRMQWNIKPNQGLDALIIPMDDQALLEQNADDIKRLGKIENLTIDRFSKPIKDAASAFIATYKIFIPLKGVVDLDSEKKRFQQDLLSKEKIIVSLSGRLGNEAFVSKAPIDVIEKEKERLKSLTKEISELTQVLNNIS